MLTDSVDGGLMGFCWHKSLASGLIQMNRRLARKVKSPQMAQNFEWRNHPIIVASGSAAATLLFCIAIFTQIVSPTQNAKLEIELLKLNDANQKLAHSIASITKKNKLLTSEVVRKNKGVTSLEAKVSSLEQELIDARANSVFTPGNPYPNGLGLIRIGMKKNEIATIYSGLKIEIDLDDPDTVTVNLVNSPFERVTYHLSNKSDEATISHVSFHMPTFDSKYSDDFLFKKLVENFGQPSKESTKKAFMWSVGSSYSLYANGKNNYVLMRRGQEPIFWHIR